jgi:hypothetical protein
MSSFHASLCRCPLSFLLFKSGDTFGRFCIVAVVIATVFAVAGAVVGFSCTDTILASIEEHWDGRFSVKPRLALEEECQCRGFDTSDNGIR